MMHITILYIISLLDFCVAGGCCGKNEGDGPPVEYRTIPVTLDITNPDKAKVHVDETTGNNRGKIFCPKTNQMLNKVVDGSTVIWMAGQGERCSFVGLTLDNNQPVSISLSIKKGSSHYIQLLYFEKNGQEWSEKKYETKKRSTANPASPSPSTKLRLFDWESPSNRPRGDE